MGSGENVSYELWIYSTINHSEIYHLVMTNIANWDNHTHMRTMHGAGIVTDIYPINPGDGYTYYLTIWL